MAPGPVTISKLGSATAVGSVGRLGSTGAAPRPPPRPPCGKPPPRCPSTTSWPAVTTATAMAATDIAITEKLFFCTAFSLCLMTIMTVERFALILKF